MTQPIEDPASDVVNAVIRAMKKVFNPNDSVFPPLGGGSETVRFLSGSVIALALWDAHAQGSNCAEPFLWVRLVRSFRTKIFPAPVVDQDNCGLPEVLQIEMGVGRCSSLGFSDGTVDWEAQRIEAEVSLDDRRRISLAQCLSKKLIGDRAVGADTLIPNGPDGGVVAWAGTIYVQL